MLTVLVILLILFVVVTVVGHGCWLIIAAILKAIFSDQQDSGGEQSARRPDLKTDLAALRRLAGYFHRAGLIDEAEANRFISLSQHNPTPPAVERPPQAHPLDPDPIIPADAASVVPASLVRTPTSLNRPTNVPQVQTPTSPSGLPQSNATVASPTMQAPHPIRPRKAMSEVLQSFLAAHNIRWGEITAGILIVVCSIGLVTSLWNTLAQTNRLIPAAIFLLAVAGIETAGLYTLNRWKLRHTSRAVLIIATMLIPLSMMAGIAIAGRGAEAVSLSQVSTWLAIISGWLATGAMIYFAGRALVGKSRALSWTAAIGLPTFLLPAIPGLVRIFGQQSIWIVTGASLAIYAILMRDAMRISRRTSRPIMPAKYQHLILHHGLAIYSAAMLAVMLVMRLGKSINVVAPLSLTLLPIGFAVFCLALCFYATRLTSSRRLQATSALLVTGLCSLVLVPIMMQHATWLTAWGVVVIGASITSGLLTRRWAMLIWVSLVSAIAFPPLSTFWFGQVAWDSEMPLWQRYVSGHGAVVILTTGLLTVAWFTEKRLKQLGALLCVLGVCLATVVGIGPQAWLIGFPRLSMTAILLVTAATTAFYLRRHKVAAAITSVPIVLAWSTVLFTADLWWNSSYEIWLPALVKVLVATSLTIAAVGETLRFAFTAKDLPVTSFRFTSQWWRQAAVPALLAGILSIFCLNFSASFAAIGLLCASTLITAAAFRGGLFNWVVVAQVSSLAAVTSIVYWLAPTWLQFDQPKNVLASTYTLFTVFSYVTACWLLVKETLVRAKQRGLTLAIRRDPVQLPVQLGTLLSWSFVGLLAFQLGNAFANHSLEEISLLDVSTGVVLAAASGMVVLCISLRSVNMIPIFLLSLLLPVNLIGLQLAVEPIAQLSLAGWTSLIVGAGLLAILWRLGKTGTDFIPRNKLRECIYALSLTMIAIVTLATATLYFGPGWNSGDWSSFRVQASDLFGRQGLQNSILGWPIVLAIIMGLIGRLTKDVGLIVVATVITVFSAPVCLILANDSLRGMEYVLAASFASFVPYLLARLLCLIHVDRYLILLAWDDSGGSPFSVSPTFQPAFVVSWIGIAVAASAASLWTIIHLLRGDLAWLDGFGSSTAWLVLYVVAASLFFQHFGKSVVPSKAMRLLVLFPIGAGLITASTQAYGLISQSTGSLISSHTLTAWLWLGTAMVAFVHGCIHKRGQTAMLAIVLATAINLFCPFAVPDQIEATLLWTLAMLILTGIGLLSHGRLGWFKTGQVIGVLGLVSALLLQVNEQFFEINFVSAALVTTAVMLAAWSMQSAWLRRHLDLYTTDAGIIGLFSGVVGLLSILVAIEVFRFGPPQYGTELLLAVTVSVLALATALVSFGLAPRRLNAAPIAFLTSLILSLVLVSCGAHLLPTSNVWPIASVAWVFIAGLWTWAWPLMRTKLYPQDQLSGHQLRLTVTILLLGMGIFVICNLLLFSGIDQASRALLVASVLGMSVVIGATSGWSRHLVRGSSQAVPPNVVVGQGVIELLPTVSVILFAGGVTLGALGLNPIIGPWGLVSMMRLLLAAAIFTPSTLWIARKVFGLDEPIWQLALRRGAQLGIGLAVVALIGVFGCELMLWNDPQIREVPIVLVVGTAVLLAAGSLGLAVCGVFPNILLAGIGQVSNNVRTAIIFAAQFLGGLTWLHLFLARPELALLGLRPYWPYIVMLLAFSSAGLTQFARNRRDDVLENAMRKSTFLLPLIPVIGFWLAYSPDSWMYLGQRSSYSIILLIAAIFYGGLALLWPSQRIPRALGILLANGAFWVMLVQTPNLSFATHPQLWLIPPAACVLLATYLEKRHLPESLLTSTRYAALLVIYISSTADIILNQIGANFWDPIILILLALIGMIVGVVTRTRAFLYLGTMFVFVGVLSMVWQAGRAIDQSWPWWVFGITMGLIMLGTLMFLEKNRVALKKLASELATWQG